MMEETISKTALARKLLLDFWSDLSQHSIAEFTNYLQENDLAEVKQTHINSAIRTASQLGVLKRVGRGKYEAGSNFHNDLDIPVKKTVGIRFVLQQTKRVLSIPISIMGLSPKEREMIPRLQGLYTECEKMLEELEKAEVENEISE